MNIFHSFNQEWHNFCCLFGMKRMLFILVVSIVILGVQAQDKGSHPQRTPADIARKQTEMLVRELNITDSVQRDTLYRMHFKYANMRNEHCTRADILNFMMAIQEELKSILTPEQFEAFMNRQLNHQPRSHQYPCNLIAPHQHGAPPPPPRAPHMPPPPPGHQPPNHQ